VGVCVAADTPDICDEALRLIGEGIEWEILPFELDWVQAAKDTTILHTELGYTSNIIRETTSEEGDVEHGFSEANHIIEWDATSEEDIMGCVEADVNVSHWRGDYLDIYWHGQHTQEMKYRACKEIDESKVQLYDYYNGARFGSCMMDEYTKQIPRLSIVLAKRTGRPVKLLHDDSHWHGIENKAGEYHFKVGVKNDGTITAAEVTTLFVRTGANLTEDLHKGSAIHNLKANRTVVRVSRGPMSCYRDGSEMAWAFNQVMSHVAAALEMDDFEVALKNVGAEGQTWEQMQQYRNEHFREPDRHSLKECIAAAKALSGWDNKWHAPGTKILPNGRYHGIGMQWSHEWTNAIRPSWCGLRFGETAHVISWGKRVTSVLQLRLLIAKYLLTK
jgi:CO/xanthine dehydrogenase Mo-binding subunit